MDGTYDAGEKRTKERRREDEGKGREEEREKNRVYSVLGVCVL